MGEVAAETDARAFLVGGPVRDLLLERPSPDLDIALEGPVQKISEALARRLEARVRKTTEFMTSTLLLEDGRELDIARTRTESYPEPGALPVVKPATLAEDLCRRDFSVNAMAMSLDPRRFGELVDPHGGREDLARRQLRVLHESSYEDDPTRMLRAARFLLRLDFALETRTATLLDSAVRERRAASVSGARLRNELECIFREAPARGLGMLQELGLLEGIGLAPASPAACEAARLLPRAARKLGVDLAEFAPIGCCLGVYAGLSDEGAAELAVRLMLDASARDAVMQAAALIGRPPVVLSEAAADSELFFALRGVRQASAVALWTVLDEAARGRLERYWRELRGVCSDVRGSDLIAAGRDPGPGFAKALDAALRAKLDDGAERAAQLAAALNALNPT
ncbi:MAG: CCA tRNA nucleotidyltransferase [Armatimonadota bacterium]